MQAKGECEVCEIPDVDLWTTRGPGKPMSLCKKCFDDEAAAEERGKKQAPQVDRSTYLQQARTSESLDGKTTLKDAFISLDEKVTLKEQLFNADTSALVDRELAIHNDASIPQDRKLYACTEAAYALFQAQQKIVFQKRQETTEAENLMRRYQSAGTDYVSQLEVKDRAKFVEFDKSYKAKAAKGKPAVNPSVEKRKTGKVIPTTPVLTRRQTTTEIERVCKEYNVKETLVRMYVTMGSTPEEAAKKARQVEDMATAARQTTN